MNSYIFVKSVIFDILSLPSILHIFIVSTSGDKNGNSVHSTKRTEPPLPAVLKNFVQEGLFQMVRLIANAVYEITSTSCHSASLVTKRLFLASSDTLTHTRILRHTSLPPLPRHSVVKQPSISPCLSSFASPSNR